MPAQALGPGSSSALRALLVLAGMALVLGFLYWARVIVIPVALAILFTFLLAPVVNALQRRGLPRVPAVVMVVVLSLAGVVGMGVAMTQQIGSLLDAYPKYEQNIVAKIDQYRQRGRSGLLDKAEVVASRVTRQLERAQRPNPQAPLTAEERDAQRAQPVRVVDSGPFRLSELWASIQPILEPLATTGLVLVLVIFMLINREDLRDRLISLAGVHQLADTTRAMDDAGERLSRYLLRQFLINLGFGLAVWLGLWAIGVPYAALWGAFAGALRYVPYLGPWLGALFPIGLSLLISREWGVALMVIALFGTLELITNMIVEPWIYGRGIGVSQAALLIAVAFWTWLWGPVGLMLASPLTVCLVVIGRHVPGLGFLDTLLGDRPALAPEHRFYQRLLAGDEDEAASLIETRIGNDGQTKVYDEVVVPMLTQARVDLRSRKLDTKMHDDVIAAGAGIVAGQRKAEPAGNAHGREPGRVLLVPARDATDETGVTMLGQLLPPDRFEWRSVSAQTLASDLLQVVELQQPDVVCILSVPPGGLSQTRYLCKRLHAAYPDVCIVVARLGLFEESVEENTRTLSDAGAGKMTRTLAETMEALYRASIKA